MADESQSYWQTGFGVLSTLAASGAFGSDGKKAARYINPKAPLAAPNPVPPPAPVAGQQGVNPGAGSGSGGFMGHLQRNWGKYAIGAAALVVVFIGARYFRKG